MSQARRILTATLLCMAFILPALAQHSDEQMEAFNKARNLYHRQKFKQASKAFRKITEDHPENGQAWMGLALSLNFQDRLEEALEAYQGALQTDFPEAAVHYNTACAYSRLNRLDESFAALDKAVETGFRNQRLLREDPDLEPIRSDPRFFAVLIGAGADACALQEEDAGLDFWNGTWGTGAKVGTGTGVYSLGKVLQGCLRIEFSMFDPSGWETMGFLYYDPGDRQWRHESFAPSGTILRHAGEVTDGQALLQGERIEGDGSVEVSRILLDPESPGLGRLRMERSEDGGATWDVVSETVMTPFKHQVSRQAEGKPGLPCMADTRRAELDSWTGTWDMVGHDGEKIGSHSLTRREDGCVIVGRFMPEEGAQAMSWTYFDAPAGEWRQNWVTEKGELIRYSGGPGSGGLRFQGERIRADGVKVSSRSSTTVSAEGTTTFRIEESDDGGKTWSLWLDANYVRPGQGAADAEAPSQGTH